MQTASAVVARDPDTCWRLFTDASLLTSWVPGLREAQIIAGPPALPTEVHFEFAGPTSVVAYTLVYTYDKDRREVRWEPKLGRSVGVSGFARFVSEPGGTRVTYGLEHGDARPAADRAQHDAERLIAAFVARLLAA